MVGHRAVGSARPGEAAHRCATPGGRRRAYSLYLWHYPILFWLRDGDIYRLDVATTALAIVLGVAAAEISHRYVEAPFRRPQATSRVRELRLE